MTKEEATQHGSEKEAARADALFAKTRQLMGEALRRAMHVAGTTEEGRARRMSQHDLADRAGVARSSIANYLTGGDASNPDLRSLCRIADALNVPPAFLLMRQEDWTRVVAAAFALGTALKDADIQAMAGALAANTNSPEDRAAVALQVARRLGVTPMGTTRIVEPGESNAVAQAQIASIQERQRLGVMTTCALPPNGSKDLGYNAAILCLCATIGATSN